MEEELRDIGEALQTLYLELPWASKQVGDNDQKLKVREVELLESVGGIWEGKNAEARNAHRDLTLSNDLRYQRLQNVRDGRQFQVEEKRAEVEGLLAVRRSLEYTIRWLEATNGNDQ